jgi:hypothetical protein
MQKPRLEIYLDQESDFLSLHEGDCLSGFFSMPTLFNQRASGCFEPLPYKRQVDPDNAKYSGLKNFHAEPDDTKD